MRNALISTAAFILGLLGVPAGVAVVMIVFSNPATAPDLSISELYTGGVIAATFPDASADVAPALEGEYAGLDASLDLREFLVRKVEFPSIAGVGIRPRLNLDFVLPETLANPFQSEQGYSLSVFHVFIDAPNDGDATDLATHTIAAPGTFDWDFHVIVNGFENTARVYSPTGELLGRSLANYVHAESGYAEAPYEPSLPVVRTRITASLPLELIGDPMRGHWRYAVGVAAADAEAMSAISGTDADVVYYDTLEPTP